MAERTGPDLAARLLADGFDRVDETVHRVLDGADESLLTWRPGRDANPVGWLVWHLTRVADDHLADLARALGMEGASQVWTSQGWYERFGLPYPPAAHGYGHTSADVAAFVATAENLLGYQDAVHARVLSVLAALTEDQYGQVVDTRWTPPVTAAVRLVSVLDDCAQHAGQAAYVRGLAGGASSRGPAGG